MNESRHRLTSVQVDTMSDMLRTIEWTGSAVRLLDQTKLPTRTEYIDIETPEAMWDAIKRLVVRGAPAIGIAAAFGTYLGIARGPFADNRLLLSRLGEVTSHLATSRPTAVNLFWALDRIKQLAQDATARGADVETLRSRLLDECLRMIDEDTAICRRIGEHALALLERSRKRSDRPIHILTHCNAGGLATAQYGTALAPIYVGMERGVPFHVFVDETRPLLQGARITAYELHRNNVPLTLICDNMAATVMSQGKVDAIIVGTDRVAANGDVANKIGTLGVAVLAKHFGVPFYVAAPVSSIDLSLKTGRDIPIEERDGAEITRGLGTQTAPDGIDVFNPAFDVTPAELVTAIITEQGVATAPYSESLSGIRTRR